MLDSNEWPVSFLGCLYAGVVPVAVNTLLTADDYAFMLAHSRAQAAIVSATLLPTLTAAIRQGTQRGRASHRHAAGAGPAERRHGFRRVDRPSSGHGRAGADAPRRPRLLAVLLRLDRPAQGHRPHARQPLVDGRALCPPRARPDGARCLLLRRQALLRLRPRQRPDLSALGRRQRRADGRAADPRCRVQALDRRRSGRASHRLLRCAHRLRRHARIAVAAAACLGEPAHVLLGRRSAAERDRPALREPLRRRHHRRHRLDRDAAHLPLEPARRRALRHHRQASRRLRGRAARRRRAAGAARRGRRSLHQGAERRVDVLGRPRALAEHLPGRLGRAAATSTPATPTATTPTPAAATTC